MLAKKCKACPFSGPESEFRGRLCVKCDRANERARYHANREKRLAQMRAWGVKNRASGTKGAKKNNDRRVRRRWEARAEVIEHYGGKCKCCGETEEAFLTIDHINGGGRKHRRTVGDNIYFWLIDKGFPEEFRVLCLNCNMGRYRNGGVCPHEVKRQDQGVRTDSGGEDSV